MIGCCGRPVSLAGLLAEADFYPAQSPQGRVARAKLAYTIAAGRAAQRGNRPAYDRAMKSLNGLGNLGIFSSSDPVVTQRASTAVTAAVRTAATSGPTLTQTMTTVSTVANLLATCASA